MTQEMAPYLFHQGTNYKAYEYLGAHREGDSYVFRVWAPNADAVYVIGEFNGWDMSLPMHRVTDGGIWQAESSAPQPGQMYKYRIVSPYGTSDKADPYAFSAETPPGTASVLCDISGFQWHDSAWLQRRVATMTRHEFYRQPINIYELHIGSWRRNADGSQLSYTQLADELIPYVKQMGYTHVEFLPVMEHPYEPSWGYQVCGYYAPSSRFGSPHELMTLIDRLHTAGIGVIFDWVPAHFPKDAHGLFEFDGGPLYEYQGSDRMEHAGWGTRRFDVGRQEVESFLVSNAEFWAGTYHADGLRVDAVASMLYLDYDRKPGEWVPNVYGDNRCLEAIAFFRKLNGHMAGQHPDVLMIAEESSAWSHITDDGAEGLGFSLKWNMGWMHDALDYIAEDALFRKYHHNKLTFSLTYAFNEKYVLPISHDEVVHGKKSLLDKMSGDYWQKFATARCFGVYMMTHPGKKLNFMGNEIGQFREWDDAGQIEWFLLDYPSHAGYQLFWADINNFYLQHPQLWYDDGGWNGFRWINPNDAEKSVYSYRRIGRPKPANEANISDKSQSEVFRDLIIVLNFTPVVRHEYEIYVGEAGEYEELFNSDLCRYGGSGVTNAALSSGDDGILKLTLPPLGALILRAR